MVNFQCGPSGGYGGSEFVDDVLSVSGKVIEVRIRSGGRIDAIQIVHETQNGQRHPFPQNGGNGGRLTALILDEDEFLIGLDGTVAMSRHKRPQPTVHQLQLRTIARFT